MGFGQGGMMATLEMERGPAKVGVATRGEKVSAFARSEALLFVILIGAAIVTRFYDLETRVMSHDESLHTYYSWLLREGRGYEHLPMMHGPLQFHLIALSYLLFGDSDATARFPAALAGVLSIALIAVFRRWLGGEGALLPLPRATPALLWRFLCLEVAASTMDAGRA